MIFYSIPAKKLILLSVKSAVRAKKKLHSIRRIQSFPYSVQNQVHSLLPLQLSVLKLRDKIITFYPYNPIFSLLGPKKITFSTLTIIRTGQKDYSNFFDFYIPFLYEIPHSSRNDCFTI